MLSVALVPRSSMRNFFVLLASMQYATWNCEGLHSPDCTNDNGVYGVLLCDYELVIEKARTELRRPSGTKRDCCTAVYSPK